MSQTVEKMQRHQSQRFQYELKHQILPDQTALYSYCMPIVKFI